MNCFQNLLAYQMHVWFNLSHGGLIWIITCGGMVSVSLLGWLDRPWCRCQLPIDELWQRAYLQQRTMMPPILGGFNLNRPCRASSVQVLNARSLGPSSCETSGAASFSFLTVISLYFCSWSFCFCSCIRWILQTAFFLIFICRQVSKDTEWSRWSTACIQEASFLE